jgi:cell division septation protein DedD
MSKDFANRKPAPKRLGKAVRKQATGQALDSRAKSGSRKQQARTVFHGPSFSAGAVLGAAIVLLTAYLPDMFVSTVEEAVDLEPIEPRAPVKFEFDTRLRSAEVHSDPNTYANDTNPNPDVDMEYLIQAASFRIMGDAESLRAQLVATDLPAQTSAVMVGSKPWFRVTVGPFSSQVAAGRAMTRLREQNLDAFLIKRPRQH